MAQALITHTILPNTRIGKSSVGTLPRGTLSLASSFSEGSFNALNARAQRRKNYRVFSSSERSEEKNAKESEQGVGVWIGRLAMVSFATAITIEISTGKGLIENLGFATPQPSLALFVTAIVIGLAVFFIYQSSSRD